MARKKNLPLGWISKGSGRVVDTGFYSREFVLKLARDFNVHGKLEYEDDVWALKERLETAGTMYVAAKHNFAGPQSRDLRAYFQELSERAQVLLDLFEQIDERSWQILWRTEQRLQMGAFFQGDDRLVNIGVVRRRNDNDPENLEAEFSDIHELPKLLRYLQLLSSESIEKLEPGTAGRKRNYPLYIWTYEMARFWVSTLRRDFTVTYHQNVPTSEAGQFLEACLTPMDADALPELVSQMRQVLQDRKNRQNKNP